MDTLVSSGKRMKTATLLNAVAALTGVLASIGLAWAVLYQPDFADYLIAISAIGLTLALIYFDPLLAFLVWLFFIPFAPFWRFDLHMPAGIPDLSYARMVGSVLAVYLFAQVALGRRKFLTITFFELAIPFFLIPLLWSAIRAYLGWLWGLQSVFDAFLIPLLAYFIARQLLTKPEDFRKLAMAILGITIIIAIAAIVEQATGFAPFRFGIGARVYSGDIRKVSSFLANPAYIGLALAVGVPLAIMLSIEAKAYRHKALYLLGLLILEMGIVATFNRSAMLGGILGPLVFSILNRRLLKYVLPVLLIIALLVGLSWNALEGTSVGNRLGAESPIDYRLEAIKTGLQIHRSAPYLGVGWGWFGRLAAGLGFRENGVNVLSTTHNSYLNFLVSGGYALLGGYLLMMLGLGVTLAVIGWPRRKERILFPLYIQMAMGALFAYVAPIAFFDNAFSNYANLIFFAVMGGAISATLGGGSLTDDFLANATGA
ncbi:MAG TPA: O-antigen ligase domain-containing protein [Anaerolineae bacterium]|nr:O-antigen ligase family protein [Caldilineae bacterium]HID34442.1 O-antigen ligase domain-containing protein [Anaerolineae bacterium]HIQ11784.1 O-antigen ligase domain-containing protein [Caldilineales bacterium]